MDEVTVRWSPLARAQLDAMRFPGPFEVGPHDRARLDAQRVAEEALARGWRMVPPGPFSVTGWERDGDVYRATVEWEPPRVVRIAEA